MGESDGVSALRLSPPLFTWDITAADQGVSFDELHQRLVHRQDGGFSTSDLLDEGSIPDGIFVKCDLQGLKSVRFSPDGLHFAYLCGAKQMGVMDTLRPTKDAIGLSFKWSKADLEVLDFFWLPPNLQQAETTDLVAITTQGIEIFRLSFDQGVAKSHKAFPANVRLCWVEPITGMALVCIGARTLQPFDLTSKSPKMPKFDLVLESDQLIKAHDVSVVPIYDATYCIHADSVNSRVSLRNISNPSQGTPDHDIVIDVACDDRAVGALRLSTADNLLIVHCLDRGMSLIFDIRHKDGPLVPCICGPCSLLNCAPEGEQSAWSSWRFLSGNTIVMPTTGRVFRLRVEMGQVLQDFRARFPSDLVAVMRLLLRRTSCREHIVQTLRRALRSKPGLNDWAEAFLVLNQAYRRAIELITQRQPAGPGRQTTVSLQELEAVISHQSILSESHMVSQVFHPHFLEVTSAGAGGSGAEEPSVVAARGQGGGCDRWRIPLPEAAAERADRMSRPARSPYILSVVMAYLRSLLGMQILPHKVLQCFVFDICMYFEQEHTLQQLVHYHVLLDSAELVARLKEVSLRRSRPWATQACLDMALRVKEHATVADLLLHTRQYLDLVPFLIDQKEPRFELRRLLEQLENDADAQEDDPDLLEHVISEIRAWRVEASVPPPPGMDQVSPPDLVGCERWMPELRDAAAPAVADASGGALAAADAAGPADDRPGAEAGEARG